MNNNKQIYRILQMIFVGLFCVTMSSFVGSNNSVVYASNDDDKMIVVSLGDSYSSGEGIEPFYGQYDISGEPVQLLYKVQDENWLAHRSTLSWPSLIEVPGIDGTMGDYITAISTDTSNYEESTCEWYFGAVSGAVTENISGKIISIKNIQGDQQVKEYNTRETVLGSTVSGSYTLPFQIDIFDQIDEPVDYVTITIGGNDIGFVDLITTCVTGSSYVERTLLEHEETGSALERMIELIWINFASTKLDIMQTYIDISKAAGSQANIIVAGYPKLFDENVNYSFISSGEAMLINNLVVDFNNEIEIIVDDLRETTGMNIYFVDVEQEFEEHGAYSEEPWINEIIFGSRGEDLIYNQITSSYSIHPNAEGAKAYARCVNAKIEEIEKEKSELKTESEVEVEIEAEIQKDIVILQEGTYSYQNGEFLAQLRVENVNDVLECYWGEWYNFGDSASVEDFIFTWKDGQSIYEVEGQRSKQSLTVTLENRGDVLYIRVLNNEGDMYYNVFEQSPVFEAEYIKTGEDDILKK